MSNVHGLYSSRRRNSSSDNDDEAEPENLYVGGVNARGGGSGLAVEPNPDHSNILDSVRSRATEASDSNNNEGEVRRTITMYRSGFVVDDGPFRRLDDPANAEFLSSLAKGKTPRELEQGGGDVTIGLIDKRDQDYKEKSATTNNNFESFSGQGNSLGGGSAVAASSSSSSGGIIVPELHNNTPPVVANLSRPVTSIQVRLLNGKRLVIKVNLDSPVSVLGDHIQASGEAGTDPYVLSSGYPPRILNDLSVTVEAAGLKGAQVLQKKE